MPLAMTLVLLADRLIPAWVGASFRASVPIAQILATVVAIRVGNATATTILKGADRHRLLAFTNLTVAIANIALSLWWIRQYGLVGQAFGTLVPIAGSSLFVLWPAACRRVKIGVGDAFRRAVWPTLWPLAPMAAVVVSLRSALPASIPSIVLIGIVANLCYAATFLVLAVKREERTRYLAKAGQLAQWRRWMPAAA
jgi:O-antigen/teichoic acid export membrane protein